MLSVKLKRYIHWTSVLSLGFVQIATRVHHNFFRVALESTGKPPTHGVIVNLITKILN